MARCVLFPHYPNYNEQIKVQSSFQVCYLHLESVAVNCQDEIQSCHYQWSKPSLGWKNKNKPIREIAKTLGVAKTTVWNILKKKERTGELSNTKRPGRPRKTTVVDDRRILSLVKKTPFTTVGQIKNTLQEVGVCVSKSTIKRRLHQSEYRGFTTRCKPLVSLKKEGQIRVCQTTSKKAFTVLEQHPMDRWDQDQLVPEWWEEKSMEKERNCSWS